MDKFVNASKCVTCREPLRRPVLLSCGHLICKSHTEVDDEPITCSDCGRVNKGFVFSQAVSDIVEQLCKLNFGQQHKETAKSCDELKKQLAKNDQILNDPNYIVYERIDALRNKVLLKSEQLKFRIDEITQELLADLDAHKASCNVRLRDKNNDYEVLKFNFKRQTDEEKTNLSEYDRVLNELTVNETRWREIQERCDRMVKLMGERFDEFEKVILCEDFASKSSDVGFFENADIDTVLKKVNEIELFSLRSIHFCIIY